MKEKVLNGKGLTVMSVFVLMIIAMFAAPVRAGAEETQALVTEYANLWTSTDIAVKVGVPVKWYVTVPEDTEPKGCGATIKIPGLGFGTDTHNKEEGHIVLQKGENFIYEFTPSETGDILFTCWMGSGCHSNYIHVTEDGTYSVPKPADPTEISAVREGDKTIVSFKASEAPEGSSIVGYTVTANAEDGTRKKASGTESPITLSGLDESKEYTIVVVTKGTSGKSAGENSFILKASGAETESPADNGTTEEPKDNATNSGTEGISASNTEQTIVTEYSELWTGNITVKVGVTVKWYVNVPEGTALNGCAKTIKIPGLGWGTDSHNKEEGHLTLEIGKNFVYEFTPSETGDILFTCWMGSGCHKNYIHVTADGKPVSNAAVGSGDNHSHTGDEAEKPADTDKQTDTDSKTDSNTDKPAENKAEENTKEEVKTNEDTSADSTSAERSDGVEKAGSGSALAAFEGANVVKEEKAESAADNGSASAPQSAAESADPNANPHTGENALPVAGSLALLLFLTVSSAIENRRKNTKD